eukprot:TRINITY_DN9700_c0_g1_i1.p1 TRINITY_DN9700_c0_g1~~TRINITY_DN9700_c0_g1_i1.p1  ORF type:complete len:229 (+),score=19.25 TRINITY_DN9700_c0_g1_i1:152-838(+)
MRAAVLILLGIIAVSASKGCSKRNLVGNPSFEDILIENCGFVNESNWYPAVFCQSEQDSKYGSYTRLGPWYATAAVDDDCTSFEPYKNTIELQHMSDAVGLTPFGKQYIELIDSCPADICQYLDTEKGATYNVSFWLMKRLDAAQSRTNFEVTVKWNGKIVYVVVDSMLIDQFRKFSFKIKAKSDRDQLCFRDTGDLGTDRGTLMDQVSVVRDCHEKIPVHYHEARIL